MNTQLTPQEIAKRLVHISGPRLDVVKMDGTFLPATLSWSSPHPITIELAEAFVVELKAGIKEVKRLNRTRGVK